MRYGSVCSGIEAASVALHPLDWEAAWLAEIEQFPAAVLAHHYPNTPNLGDMTKIAARVLSGEVEAPDVLIGGTPCQAFSVAGLRNSLDDDRGQLSISFIHLADAIDAVRRVSGRDASIVWWENVPGVLSTKDNAFGCFLAGLVGEDCELQPPGKRWADAGCVFGPKRAAAWRILDAQYFGLAQRRRRVFVVASARNGFDPAAVLFERESVRRDHPPRRETGEGITASPGGIAGNVSSKWSKGTGGPAGDEHYNLITHSLRGDGFDASEDGTGRGTPLVPIAFAQNQRQELREMHVAGALSAIRRGDAKNETLLAFHGAQDPDVSGDVTHPLGRNQGQEVCIAIQGTVIGRGEKAGPQGAGFDESGVSFTQTKTDVHAVMTQTMQVRRLTPRECERLQGFNDDYTLIPVRGKPAADGPRYKALGNSMAVPVMRWIGERIALVDEIREARAAA